MMVGEAQAKLLHQWVDLLRPQRILEIGTFTGYSTLAMASALLPAAQLITLELNPNHATVARDFIKKAGLCKQIELKQGPAKESLLSIVKQTPNIQFDLIFIDADKGGYIHYFDEIINNNLLSERGLILVDNVLFFGQVHREAGYHDPQPIDASKNIKNIAKKVHAFNEHVLAEERVEVVVMPIFDGLSIIRKKKTSATSIA
ncbi:O-methyltransferase [Spinellus fusiger]|nr:O-methyltransferase [Spinellus fusiger]